jgi:hypothetical protein
MRKAMRRRKLERRSRKIMGPSRTVRKIKGRIWRNKPKRIISPFP